MEHEQFVLIVPVLIAIGIGSYFSGIVELDSFYSVLVLCISFVFFMLSRHRISLFRYIVFAMSFIIIGYFAAVYRVYNVDTPTLDREIRPTNVIGTVEYVHMYEDGKIRLTLRDTEIEGLKTLKFVNFRINKFDEMPYPGDRIKIRAGLMPPPGPSMPGDYDYARQVWFQGISAVGYSVSPLEIIEKNQTLSSELDKLRQHMAERIKVALPGETGTLAAALITGIRGGMTLELTEAMRDAGLAHLLAISGLHMGLLCGVVFFAARYTFSFFPRLALRYPIKKWAAVVAGIAGLGYLVISGSSIPTIRAFIMVIIVFLAVIADRKAISLRLVAIAATFILVIRPEALVGVSFQMSFAAAIALVIVFERFGNEFMNKFRGDNSFRHKILYFIVGSLFTSLIAELAIAPFALYHFNKVILYGLLANLVAMPVMGSWVMPWIVLTLVLFPVGLEKLALIPMSWGLEIIMATAYWVSGLPGSTLAIPAIDLRALVFIVLGALWLGIWRLKWRYLGIPLILTGVYLAVSYVKPDILIDNTGRTIAIRNEDNSLMLNRMNGSRIFRERWLQRFAAPNIKRWEYDSFPMTQSEGREISCDSFSCLYQPSRSDNIMISIVQNEFALMEDCAIADAVISMVPVEVECPARLVLDRWDFYNNGGYAIWLPDNDDEFRYQNVKDSRGNFPWVN